MNHDQLTALGFVRQPDGNYAKPKAKRLLSVPLVRQAPVAIPERPAQHEPMAAQKGEAAHAGRFLVRIVAYRHRLLDPDNLCPKYFVDCLRYAEIIPNDRQADIELVTTQRKIDRKTEETTEILITEI